MPRFDGKGPEGKGPKTGLGQGNCKDEKPCANNGQGRRGCFSGRCGRNARINRQED